MNQTCIFITGTGALSKAIVDALTASPVHTVQVYIYSRSYTQSSWLATIGNTRSVAFNTHQQYFAGEADWKNELPLFDTMSTLQPALVIHTASLQSVWTLAQKNVWTDLVKESGYGITLPLQCLLASKIAKTIAAMPSPPLFINCCYPDIVNYVLTNCQLPVFSGIGNIGIIEALLAATSLPPYKMLANHFHIQQLTRDPEARTTLPKIWINNTEVDSHPIFNNLQLINDQSLNSITALSCIKLVTALLHKKQTMLHLAGPQGLPGGYPVFISNGQIESTGTGILPAATEFDWHKQILQNEGVSIGIDGIQFNERTFDSISKYSKELAKGFTFNEASGYFQAFQQLVQSLINKV